MASSVRIKRALLSVSDKLAGMGLEHQRSSDNGTTGGYYKNWDQHSISRGTSPVLATSTESWLDRHAARRF